MQFYLNASLSAYAIESTAPLPTLTRAYQYVGRSNWSVVLTVTWTVWLMNYASTAGRLSAEEVSALFDYESTSRFSPLNDSNFFSAINLWFTDEANATAIYGHISDWNVSADKLRI